MVATYTWAKGSIKKKVLIRYINKPKIDKNTLLNFSQVFGVRVHIKLAFYKLNILGA